MAVREIRALTGLRGAAALGVVLYHADINFGPVLGRIVRHGYLAVDLFFILSGFVMALTYGHKFSNCGSRAAYGAFLLLRFGRIYPLYFVLTLLCLPLYHYLAHPIGGGMVLTNLLLVQGWGLNGSIIGPGWSISTEEAAYLLFPLVAVLCLHGGWRSATAWALLCAMIIPFIAAQPTSHLGQGLRNGPLDVYGTSVFPVLRCLAEFSLGMLLWRISGNAAFRHKWTGDAVSLALGLALLIHGADVIIVACFALAIPAYAAGTSQSARFLASPPLHWLGVVSYSLYLVHVPFLDAATPFMLHMLAQLHLPRLVSVANGLLIPVIIGLAYLTYSAIERPGRILIRRLTTQRPALVAAPPEAEDEVLVTSRVR